MSDIFLSCATSDGVTAAKLAEVFRQQGWSVWWDASSIRRGADFIEAVMEECQRSKVVIVLWSRAARESRLVREVLTREGLLPLVVVQIEKVETMPFIFVDYKRFNLSDWSGGSHEGLQNLLHHLRTRLGAPRPATQPEAVSEPVEFSGREKNAETLSPENDRRFRGVFISYRRGEAAAYAGRLYDRLAARFGKERVFFDHENVGWGEDFVEVITEAAGACVVMIVLISRGWSRGADAEVDDYVRLEVATALGRKIRVIPILIQGAQMPAAKELHEDLAPLVRRNALALSDTRWERDVEDLIKTLESILKD